MNDFSDQQLLRDYAARRSEPAFAELVRRHVDLVHSAALRMVRDAHLAKDVTQGAFVALAQNAGSLTERAVLSGWLHRTAQNLAANAVRTEVRRRARETEAVAMNEIFAAEPDASWENIAPHLDAALDELGEADRDALLLRYFERKSASEMAHTLGISDAAAQKRVNRAVEKLRDIFAKRKITVGAGGLAVVISAHAVQAAPAGLAATISAAAILTGTVVHTSTIIAATKTIAMTTLQKTIVTAALAAVAGAGIYEARQAAQLREQNLALHQQQNPLNEDLAKLRSENERLSNLLAQANDQKKLSEAQHNELLKLRGQTGQAQTALQELAKSRAAAKQPNAAMPALMANAMKQLAATTEKSRKKQVPGRVAKMKEQLHLTDAQARSINDLMVKNIEDDSQRMLKAMSGGKLSDIAQADAINQVDEETEIKALLNPEQLSAYADYKQAEALASAQDSAKAQVSKMADELSLSTEQQNQIRPLLAQYSLDSKLSFNPNAAKQAMANGDFDAFVELQSKLQQQGLDGRLKMLEPILTPAQLQKYRQSEQEKFDMLNDSMKMFLPQTNNAAAQ